MREQAVRFLAIFTLRVDHQHTVTHPPERGDYQLSGEFKDTGEGHCDPEECRCRLESEVFIQIMKKTSHEV